MSEYKYKLKDSVTDEMLDSIFAINAKSYLLFKTTYYLTNNDYNEELCYKSENGYNIPESFVEEIV